MDLTEYIEKTALNVDKAIDRYFGAACDDLGKASAHLLLAGGKRLRPAVVLLAADAVKKEARLMWCRQRLHLNLLTVSP
jgi:Geranylgeranyl pyrophosphate synthase